MTQTETDDNQNVFGSNGGDFSEFEGVSFLEWVAFRLDM